MTPGRDVVKVTEIMERSAHSKDAIDICLSTISNHIHFVSPSFNVSDSTERAQSTVKNHAHTRAGHPSIPALIPVAKLSPARCPVFVGLKPVGSRPDP